MSDVQLDTKVPQTLLRPAIPRRRHPVLDEYAYKKQQALISWSLRNPDSTLSHQYMRQHSQRALVKFVERDTTTASSGRFVGS